MKYLILLLAVIAFNLNAEVYTGYFSNKAVSGYDTVAYFTEGKPVKGKKEFKTEYEGAQWLFSSKENLELFVKNPEKYAPQYGGFCAWAVAVKKDKVSADPKQWKIVNGKLYLNYDKSVKEKWLKNESKFITDANQIWPTIKK